MNINIENKIRPRQYHYGSNGTPFIYPSQEEMDLLMDEVVRLIHESGIKFDHLVSVANSGVSLGKVVADVLAVTHEVYRLGYSDDRKLIVCPGSLFIDKNGDTSLPYKLGSSVKNILIFDHLNDGGKTFENSLIKFANEHSGDYEIKTACLWQKEHTGFKADFIGTVEPNDPATELAPWIVTPNEQKTDILKNKYKF